MATNIKYLKENNLYEAHKHFMRLCETYATPIPEEYMLGEDDDQEQDPMAGGADPMAGGPDAGMGGDPNAAGGAPGGDMGGDMGADPMAGGPDAGMGGDPMAGGDMGGAPGGDMGGGDMGADPMAGGPDAGMGDDPMAGGDIPPMDDAGMDDGSTIDIDGLTKAQERLNVKQNQVGRDMSKIDQRMIDLMGAVEKLTSALDANNSEIETLKAEFEKRNPTQTEKLNLRSLDSYPFNVKPTDYWAEKNKQGGYEAYSDNNEPTTKEYVITNDDVDDVTSDIADTFFNIDDDDIQTLDKIFRY